MMAKTGPKPRSIEQAVAGILECSERKENGCLLFTVGATVGNGPYRDIRAGGKSWYVHRLIFFERHGYLPEVVRHKCDKPSCVEISHLLDGTHADNVADKIRRGRNPVGSAKPEAVLTELQVATIFRETNDMTYAEIGRAYGVSRGAIHNIKSGRTWNHVTGLERRK